MGTQTFALAVCWLAVIGLKVSAEKAASKTGLIDNISAESVSRLYRNVPVGVYASATPYGAYSFHVPSFIAPKNTVKGDSVISPNTNSYLKDSYGNQFVEAPQAFSYRNSFPQQFVQLQNLPAHLSQPLVSPALQFKQSTPHFFSPGQYNVQNIQSASPVTSNRYAVQQPLGFNNQQGFAPNSVVFAQLQPQIAQQQTSNTKNIYSNALQNYNKLNGEQKFQRLQELPHFTLVSNDKPNGIQLTAQSGQLQQVQQPQTQTTITTLPNGKKIALNLVTKPPVPLLDLSLLEPLTFANPLVPQVQHFLPRINQATYHKLPNVNVPSNKQNDKEFAVTSTKSHDNGNKPKHGSSKKKQKKIVTKHQTDDEKEIPSKSTITTKGTPNESPEFTYEINSPNYKETYTEKKVSYNKETESEPKTYNYEMKTENKPVHYSYQKNTQDEPIHESYETHTGKEPVHYTYEEQTQKEPIRYSYVKTSKEPTTHYQNKNQNPEHLIYTVKSNEQDIVEEEQRPRHHPRENSEENSDESSEDNGKNENIENQHHNRYQGRHVESGESPKNTQENPEHREIQYYTSHRESPKIVQHHSTPQSFGHTPKNVGPIQHEQQYFQPIVPEYEEDIRILPQHKAHEAIRVDPNQHVQTNRNAPPPQPQNHQIYYDYPESHYSAAPIIKGKPKQTHPDEEESSEDTNDENNARVLANMFKEQEKNEENFEKSYKDAAYGFAAYDAPRVDTEKEIYNPESYGAPRYYAQYNVAKSPLEQYEADGDGFPKFSRLNYKDTRDKMQEDYYLDYAVSKPKSLQDRYRNKEGYYNLYKNQKPEHEEHDHEDSNKRAKYTSYEYTVPEQKHKNHAKQKANPESYEYDYSSQQPRDAAAHATRPLHRYKSKTQFVEPQFQYGFEPISIPQLLDSELAAMASNDNPKSEKQGTRKKIYKENLFIKKTSSKGAKRTS